MNDSASVEAVDSNHENVAIDIDDYDAPTALMEADPGSLNNLLERIRLVIYPEERRVAAENKSHERDWMSEKERNGRLFICRLHIQVDASRLADWLRAPEQQETLGRICDGYDVVWTGSNNAGRLSDDAGEALTTLRKQISPGGRGRAGAPDVPTHRWRAQTVAQWVVGLTSEELASIGDDEMEEVVEEIRDEARDQKAYLVGDLESEIRKRARRV